MVELLVVLTIMGILSALAVSSVSSLRSTALSASGNQMVDVFAMARQRAISNNDFTAVVILTSGSSACSGYCVIELPSQADGSRGADWAQVTPWKFLPRGVVFETGLSNDTFMSSSLAWSSLTALPSSPSTLLANYQLQGSPFNLTTPGNAVVQCFQPDGTLMGGQSLALTLIQGSASSTGVTSLVGGMNASTARPNDYYDLYFVANTGTTKIGRP